MSLVLRSAAMCRVSGGGVWCGWGRGLTAPSSVTAIVAPPYRLHSNSSRETSATWERHNERLGRPMSPHLTIYKFQLTSMMSITHRMTGLALHFGLLAFSTASVLLPHSFPHYLQLLADHNLGHAALVAGKLLVAWAFFFHLGNGVRHLLWDLGKGFSLTTLYRSGYAVLAMSTVAAVALMFV